MDYQWKRKWVLRGTREDQTTNLLPLDYFWEPSGRSNKKSFTLNQLANVPVLILLGEPGIGKSSELATYYEGASEDKDQNIWNLQKYPPSDFHRFLESHQFKSWHNLQKNLILFLDSFDESSQTTIDLGRNLTEALDNRPERLKNLQLRIACRTADWPEETTTRLKNLFGESNVLILELGVLGQDEVISAANSHQIDPQKFIEQIEHKALAPLTFKPLTLIDLLKEYLNSNGVLHDNRNALYNSMCRRLLEENSLYHDANRNDTFTVNELLAEASRLAFIMLTTRSMAIWMPSSTKNMPHGSISINQLHHGTSAEERLTRAALQTGFFSSRGPNQLGWAHLSYAEYLAAFYMHYHLSPPQIKSLLVHPEGSKIIPQLREITAWITTLQPVFLKFIMDLDPEALFQSDLIVEDINAREALTTLFLNLFHQEVIIEIPSNIRSRYQRLKHPNLAEQLIKFARDDTRNQMSRYVAIYMALECELQEVADALVDFPLDTSLDYELRTIAAHLIAEVGSRESKIALKPLINADPFDIHDSLKGYALSATWPKHLTTSELFKALTPLRDEMYIGAYSSFLRLEIVEQVPIDELPIALSWAADYIERYTDEHHHINLVVQDLIDEIVYKSWVNFEVSGIPKGFANLILAKASKHQPLFGRERNFFRKDLETQLEDPYQGVLSEFVQNEARRHTILLAVIDEITNPKFEYNILSYSVPLLLETDLFWLLELLQKTDQTITENKIVKLIKVVFRSWNLDHMVALANVIETTPLLQHEFNQWLFVPLKSQYAEEIQKAYQRNKEYQAKHQELEMERAKQLIDPPPLVRLEEILDLCEAGENKEWWRTNRWLASDDYGNFSDWYDDIRNMPNWKKLSENTRERVILSGIEYVFNEDANSNEWFGKHNLWRPAFAAYRMLFLLHDLEIDIPTDIWHKWMPVIVSFPSSFIRSGHAQHRQFVATAYEKAGYVLRYYLKEFLDYSSKPNSEAGIVENYLLRFEYCFDEPLVDVVVEYLDNSNLSRERYFRVLSFLLEKRVSKVEPRVISEFEKSYQRYITMLPHLFGLMIISDGHWKSNPVAISITLNYLKAVDGLQSEIILLASKLVAYSANGAWWNIIWNVIKSDEEIGRSIIEASAGYYDSRNLARLGSQISEKETADLYLWTAERYPHNEDPSLNGWVSPRHNVSDWRDGLIIQLAERGTTEALEQLDRIRDIYPNLYRLKRLRKNLVETLYKKTWYPPQVSDVMALLENNEQRFVQTDNQLLEVIIESLDRLQKRLQGETPSAVDLWNIVSIEGICRPKDEQALSNYIKRHFDQDLKSRQIIVNREVEIRQKEGEQDAASGEIPDLYVSAIAQGLDRSQISPLVVLIEVKGNWHKDLRKAAETQLVERYLRDNDRATCGLYLVGWFNCRQWDQKDTRRRQAMTRRNTYDGLANELKQQTADLSKASLDVRSYVLNVSLRDDYS